MLHVGATPAARGAHLPGGRVRKAVRIDMREGLAQRSAARDGRGGRMWITGGQVAKRHGRRAPISQRSGHLPDWARCEAVTRRWVRSSCGGAVR